uniref:Uncharacterized protein n=1 Tax=Romanomermis culicivorax TaxID=13658 RepID=A0A915L5P4_ROMCU
MIFADTKAQNSRKKTSQNWSSATSLAKFAPIKTAISILPFNKSRTSLEIRRAEPSGDADKP